MMSVKVNNTKYAIYILMQYDKSASVGCVSLCCACTIDGTLI